MSALIGQQAQERDFIDAQTGARGAHAWLLTGPKGIGKAGFARRAACWLIAHGEAPANHSESLDVAAAHPAMPLIEHGAHPEYLWLKRDIAPSKVKKADADNPAEEDLARNITVDQVRALIGRMRNKPAVAARRAVVIDSIDDLERGAANALLKTLEEPPEHTVFFLVSHNPGRLLPTIRSRCRSLRFAPLDNADMQRALAAARPGLDAPAVVALSKLGEGSPGRALAYAAIDGIDAIDQQLRAIASSGDRDNRLRTALARQFGLAAAKPKFDVMLAQALALTAEAAHSGGQPGQAALAARARILDIGGPAVRNSEDLATVAFAIGSSLAGLAINRR